TGLRNRRKLIFPFVWSAGVDDSAGVMSFSFPRNDGIQWTAPTAPYDFDVRFGIRSRRHGPQNVIGIGHIDVVINNDNIAAEIRACMAIAGDHSRLARVSWISLLDRDENIEPRGTRLVTPHTGHIRNTRGFQLFPDKCRSQKTSHIHELTWRPGWRGTKDDGIVAMIQPFDFNDRLRPYGASIVAGPFAEWTLGKILVGQSLTFNNNFGIGWDW